VRVEWAAEVEVVEAAPCFATMPVAWAALDLFEPDTGADVCAPMSRVRMEVGRTRCTGAGLVRRASTTASATRVPPVGPRNRHRGLRFDSATGSFSL
jgi:hypothetical protein